MKRTKKKTVDEVVKQVKRKQENKEAPPSSLLLIPTGASLLNLACSDSIQGGWGAGKIVNLIGDSSSGKTILALSMFAEVCRRPEFEDYRLIYDDVEQALEFDISRLFGKSTAERIEPPAVDNEGEPVYSDVIQDFFAYTKDAIQEEKPFIYVLDSFDALTSKEEANKVDETLKAHIKGTKTAGSYNMDKPKIASQILRSIKSSIKSTKSLLVIISQTRDNIGMGFEKKTRSGGRALKFYSSHEIWLAMTGKIKRKGRIIGNEVRAKVTKNKITGKLRVVDFPVYYDYGVDSISSEISFLIEEEHWEAKNKGAKIIAPEFEFEGTRQALIKKIEGEGLESRLTEIVSLVWMRIEEDLKLRRKSKYD